MSKINVTYPLGPGRISMSVLIISTMFQHFKENMDKFDSQEKRNITQKFSEVYESIRVLESGKRNSTIILDTRDSDYDPDPFGGYADEADPLDSLMRLASATDIGKQIKKLFKLTKYDVSFKIDEECGKVDFYLSSNDYAHVKKIFGEYVKFE